MSKTGLRFHPYSQQESHHNKSNKENLNPVKPKSSNSNKKLIFETKKTNNSNYDYQYYLNGADSTKKVNAYPTLLTTDKSNGSVASKSILKKRTNELSKTSKQTDGIEWLKKNKINTSAKKEKQEEMSMKIFTVTTKSLIYYSKKFADKSAMKSVQVGSYLFEIIAIYAAQLDSAIVFDADKLSKEFTIKDSFDRIKCVFHEIDRKMDRVIRSSYIRCVGQYNNETSMLTCYSVRQATEHELIEFGQNINMTNAHIKAKYF